MPSRLKTVIELLHTPGEISLATHSASVPGYPFVTSVAFATDDHHRPILLLSRLAEHTQNLLVDARVGLVVARPLGDGEIARASFIGTITPIEASAELRNRYLRFHPAAERFLQLGDFAFYRVEPLRIRVVGGFAQAGWLDGKQLADAPRITLATEAVLIETHQARLREGLTLLGIDAYGVDYVADGIRGRSVFASGPVLPDAINSAMERVIKSW